MNEEDIRADVFSTGLGQPSTIRVTHMPTGLVVTREAMSKAQAIVNAKVELSHMVEHYEQQTEPE